MTGDPLDRIEDHFATLWAPVVWGQAQTDALTRIQERTEALVEVARAARDSGWRDADGLCWCDQSQELTGKPHRPQCLRMRAALARLDGPR